MSNNTNKLKEAAREGGLFQKATAGSTLSAINPGSIDENVKLLVEQLVKQGYPPLLKQRHVEELTGLGKSTIEQARLTGRLKLPFCRLGGKSIRYPLDSTAAFIVGLQRFTSTSEADSANE
jgi:hypothetical protein